MSDFPETLPFIAEMEVAEAASHLAKARRDNLRHLRLAWPDWPGPVVSDDLGGRCSVGTTCVRIEGAEQLTYWYCAPCRILEILDNGNTFRVAVEYDDDAPAHCLDDNGTVLILDLSEINAPVDLLWKLRKFQ
mgnify:CR=1 FL=1